MKGSEKLSKNLSRLTSAATIWQVAKPNFIELPGCEPIPILYEDRSALAIDKPRGWMLAPVAWQNTSRNLPAAIESSIAARDFWARSRGLKFLRHVHRLDADTSGILLFAKSPAAVGAYSDPFTKRPVEINAPPVNFLKVFGF